MQQAVPLKKLEFVIYFCGWTVGIAYGAYCIHLQTSTYFNNYEDNFGDFSPGWIWTGRKLDTADPEWREWIPLLYRILPWNCAHVVGGQIIKYFFNSTVLCCWYVLISTAFLLSFLGLPAVIFVLLQPSLSCLLLPLRNKTAQWILHLSCVVILNRINAGDNNIRKIWMPTNAENYNALMIVLSLIQLKSISFSLDSIGAYRSAKYHGGFKEFLQILGYCLYFPTLLLGPLILYPEFIKGINAPYEQWNFQRLGIIILNLSRFLFWIFFTEFLLHFLYINALHFQPQLIRGFDGWAFYAFGYCMGQYFSNKYVVVYGFSSVFARAENIADLQTPKCISRITLYSDMWKYFDRGLHNLLVRYIYLPCGGTKSPLHKILASFLSFCFIYVWHGTDTYVFVWSALNFAGLTIENLFRNIGSSKTYTRMEIKVLSPQNARRFHCILASPLYAISTISNFYFLAGLEIGNIFIYRIFNDSWKTIFTLMSVIYCGCQVSAEIKRMEIR